MICTVGLSKNGITTCVLNYSKQLVLNGVVVHIVAPNIVSEEIREYISVNGMKLYEITTRQDDTLNYFVSLVKVIRSGNYDIIHAHGNSCTLAVELWAAMLGGCKIRISHSHNTTCEYKKIHRLLRPLFELSCNERFACGEDAGKWLFGKKKFFVIKNGIFFEKYGVNGQIRDKIRSDLHIPHNGILLGHVGLFIYQKNHEFLVDVMKIMPECYYLVCIGDGEYRKRIEQLVANQDFEDRVHFTGDVNNVSDYLQAMDCFLLPSRYEGLPYVLVEAQAAGLPCVVADTVTKEANLTNSMRFVPIDTPLKWLNAITEVSNEMEYANREHICQCWQDMIAAAGYDITKNANHIKELYSSFK
jgi:Glycosyltransferase